jgi:hypothetical protein
LGTEGGERHIAMQVDKVSKGEGCKWTETLGFEHVDEQVDPV